MERRQNRIGIDNYPSLMKRSFPRHKNKLDKEWLNKQIQTFSETSEYEINEALENKEYKETLMDHVYSQLFLLIDWNKSKIERELNDIADFSYQYLSTVKIKSFIEKINKIIKDKNDKLVKIIYAFHKFDIIEIESLESKYQKESTKCFNAIMNKILDKLILFTLNFGSKIRNVCYDEIINLRENFCKTIQDKYLGYIKKINQIINSFFSLNLFEKDLTNIYVNAIFHLFNSTENALNMIKEKVKTIFLNFDSNTAYFPYENIYESFKGLNNIQFIVNKDITKYESLSSIDFIKKTIKLFSEEELEDIRKLIKECESKYLESKISSIVLNIEENQNKIESKTCILQDKPIEC